MSNRSRGAIVGAIAGFAARGAVALYYTGAATAWFALPSAGIGALVGWIAGGTCRPGRGAIVGGVLSGVVFGLFLIALAAILGPLGALFGEPQAGGRFLQAGLPYALQMGLAGALAGAIGGAAGAGSTFGTFPADAPHRPSKDRSPDL